MNIYLSVAAHLLQKETDLVVYVEGFWRYIQSCYSGTYQSAKLNAIEEPAHHLLYQYQYAPHFLYIELKNFNSISSHAIATSANTPGRLRRRLHHRGLRLRDRLNFDGSRQDQVPP